MRGDASQSSEGTDPLTLLCWWGGFAVGPLLAAAVYLDSDRGSARRSHAGAAALMWTVVLVVWAPFSFWVILLGGADPDVLLIGAPIVVGISLLSCTYGTVQALRRRSFTGRAAD